MSEPGTTLRFSVTLDESAHNLGTWSKCEGLAVEYEIFEYQEGGVNEYVHRLPGRCKYTNVKLTRPLDEQSAKVASWVSSGLRGVQRDNATIKLLDPTGQEICHWTLAEACPVKWTGPTLDAAGNQIATEVLELAHHGFLPGGGAS
jgi:phage tail-like protein